MFYDAMWYVSDWVYYVMLMMFITVLFQHGELLINNSEIKRRRVKRMSNAEIMAIIISFYQPHERDFNNDDLT